MALVVKNTPANAGNPDLIPGSGRSPGEGNGIPLQYSCLENPMDVRDLIVLSREGRDLGVAFQAAPGVPPGKPRMLGIQWREDEQIPLP